ncbi:hypothetical protein CR203_15360 [Salipaludibacillus neizhouensis]|uniref:Uncharacterized protein n=1 Tax=Salipaludibacillus neizhouensis TaxID=885475 RepID=A0A3A9K7F2_9BACI|nr:hypothetical protein [Salipaludibacillus neizhouensis]RKL66271.1 hypothetical protein CR203_15360 [Salipaludibacillus neizhouensis]
MELIDYSYKRRGMKAWFDDYPNSPVILRVIGHYYIIYRILWSECDPVVKRTDLIEMEKLINRELGTEQAYLSRKRMG